MVRVKKEEYIVSISFSDRKSITKRRKELFRINFGEFKFNNDGKTIFFENEDIIVVTNGEDLRIISENYDNIYPIIEKIFKIFEVKHQKDEYIANTIVACIVNDDSKDMDALKESRIISSFLNLKDIEDGFISSVEYITFSKDLLKDKLISVSLEIDPKGIEVKNSALLKNIKEVSNQFQELIKFSQEQVVNKILEKAGD